MQAADHWRALAREGRVPSVPPGSRPFHARPATTGTRAVPDRGRLYVLFQKGDAGHRA
jgi:hypothetical protein